jgi:hypothetical protein
MLQVDSISPHPTDRNKVPHKKELSKQIIFENKRDEITGGWSKRIMTTLNSSPNIIMFCISASRCNFST